MVEWKNAGIDDNTRRLFRDFKFVLVFTAGAIATFPIFVPPFFLPLYSGSLGFSSAAGAGLIASFNFSSAVGRIFSGLACDWIGPLNALFIALSVSALSMLALWPVSNSLAPLIIFSIINGASNGGFFATMPTVVGNVFGSARMGVAMGMIVSGWSAGYLMVSLGLMCVLLRLNFHQGRTYRGIPTGGLWRREGWATSLPACYVLCRITGFCCSWTCGTGPPEHQ